MNHDSIKFHNERKRIEIDETVQTLAFYEKISRYLRCGENLNDLLLEEMAQLEFGEMKGVEEILLALLGVKLQTKEIFTIACYGTRRLLLGEPPFEVAKKIYWIDNSCHPYEAAAGAFEEISGKRLTKPVVPTRFRTLTCMNYREPHFFPLNLMKSITPLENNYNLININDQLRIPIKVCSRTMDQTLYTAYLLHALMRIVNGPNPFDVHNSAKALLGVEETDFNRNILRALNNEPLLRDPEAFPLILQKHEFLYIFEQAGIHRAAGSFSFGTGSPGKRAEARENLEMTVENYLKSTRSNKLWHPEETMVLPRKEVLMKLKNLNMM